MNEDNEKLRIDKWLWAARFYKTRSLAAEAVDGGKVKVNGVEAKRAKTVGAGDKLELRLGRFVFDIDVLGISNKRGSAPDAQKLYRETDESKAKRALLAEQLRVDAPLFLFKGRPSKRDRRQIAKFQKTHDES
ncbi:MAG: RNA-binding S4 domain-containing protein [Gallionella sp.]|nr:RNA-binding S4 domain-containing protein [Gallionella sp.]